MLRIIGRITAIAVALSLASAANGAFTTWIQADGANLYGSSAAALGDLTPVTGVNADVTLGAPGSGWLQVWGINTSTTAFITSWGHDINASVNGAGVSASSYTVLNPTVNKEGTVFRWENSAATGNGALNVGSDIVTAASAVAVSLANGVKSGVGAGDSYSNGSDSNNVAYLLGVLEISASSNGVTELRFEISALKITGAGTSASGAVHFGWADATNGETLISDPAGGSTVGATSSGWDARITVVPEPVTVALLGLGGLALIRRRKVA